MTGSRSLIPALLAAAAFMAALCSGCGPKEAQARRKSVSEIDAQIQKIQEDASMPPQAKGIVLANLQRDRSAAAKIQAGGK